MSESILISIKKILGLAEDYTIFDADVIMAINTALFTLWQLGVGHQTASPYMISSTKEKWSDYVEESKIEACKSYVALRVRLLFDPPTSGFLVDAINDQIKEYEWRMTVAGDVYAFSSE